MNFLLEFNFRKVKIYIMKRNVILLLLSLFFTGCFGMKSECERSCEDAPQTCMALIGSAFAAPASTASVVDTVTTGETSELANDTFAGAEIITPPVQDNKRINAFINSVTDVDIFTVYSPTPVEFDINLLSGTAVCEMYLSPVPDSTPAAVSTSGLLVYNGRLTPTTERISLTASFPYFYIHCSNTTSAGLYEFQLNGIFSSTPEADSSGAGVILADYLCTDAEERCLKDNCY